MGKIKRKDKKGKVQRIKKGKKMDETIKKTSENLKKEIERNSKKKD